MKHFILAFMVKGKPMTLRFHIPQPMADQLPDEAIITAALAGKKIVPDEDRIALLRFDTETECKATYNELHSKSGITWSKLF